MTCCHGINLMFGVKFTKRELIQLFIKLNLPLQDISAPEFMNYQGTTYGELYNEHKQNCYRNMYDNFFTGYMTFEEFLSDHPNYLEDDIDSNMEEFTHNFIENMHIYDFDDFEFSKIDMDVTEYGFEHSNNSYVFGFHIGRRSNNELAISVEPKDFLNFEDEIKKIKKYTQKKPQIIAVMSGCSCCS